MKGLPLILALVIAAQAAVAQEGDWPCIQRRIDHLSLGQVWAGPVPDEAVTELAKSPYIRELAQHLQLRRTPMEEAEAMIANFAAKSTAQELTALYLATFQRIDRARSAIIAGIGRYARKQEALDDRIDATRAEMARLLAEPEPDHDRIDALETELDWDIRVFQDRQQSLTYVCETPVILEKRAFALGRAVMAQMR